jgi:hypothetical protein
VTNLPTSPIKWTSLYLISMNDNETPNQTNLNDVTWIDPAVIDSDTKDGLSLKVSYSSSTQSTTLNGSGFVRGTASGAETVTFNNVWTFWVNNWDPEFPIPDRFVTYSEFYKVGSLIFTAPKA